MQTSRSPALTDTLATFADDHPNCRIVPDAEAAFLTGEEMRRGLQKRVSQVADGMSLAPVFRNSQVSAAVLTLAPETNHGPVRNTSGFVHFRVLRSAGSRSLEISIGELFKTRVGNGDSFQVPPMQTYSIRNVSTVQQCEVYMLVCPQLLNYAPSGLPVDGLESDDDDDDGRKPTRRKR
eukprot:Polyplicarium_translucidae@DN1827_c0_g1_i1.p1